MEGNINILPVISEKKRIALVAHDCKKTDLIEWATFNKVTLSAHEITATGTTGKLLEDALQISVNKLKSGPLGGDQQIGSRISEGLLDFLIFFWDPMSQQPHDTDVKALLRISMVWNIPVACNRSTADFLVSSPLMTNAYRKTEPNYEQYERRQLYTS